MSPRSKPPDLALQAMSQTDLTEREVQRRIVDMLRRIGWDVTVTSDRRRSITKGLPDLYATHRGYKRSLWVECKAPKGRPSDDQVRWMDATRAAGVPCLVAHHPDHVTEWLRKEEIL